MLFIEFIIFIVAVFLLKIKKSLFRERFEKIEYYSIYQEILKRLNIIQ